MEQMPNDLMGYDRAITLFSPDGRLLQVEYAKKTVSQGSAAVGIVGKDSVVFAADKRLPEIEKLIIPESIEKVFKINNTTGAAMSGMIADGRALVEKAQMEAQQHQLTYSEPADMLLMIKKISSDMQVFTQYGGARPYGVSILFGGIRNDIPSLFMLEPSGIFFQYKAIAIGEQSNAINKSLEDGYKESMDVDALVKLAVKSLKAGDVKLHPDRFEIAVIDKTGFRKLGKDEIAKYL
jgi:proteasome alpha subunit